MQQIINIFKKEFRDYFVSPIAYIVIAIFLLITGYFFFNSFFLINQAILRNFFGLLPIMFSFVVPAVTMRLFSEELSIGSYEILLTMPVTLTDIIVGKFLASIAFIVVMLLPTIFYPITISLLGELDMGPVIGGYLGAIFMGGAFSAIGIFASSLSRNQIVAFIIALTLCFALTLINKLLFFFPASVVDILNYLGADYHFQNVSRGIIDTRDVLYFLSVMFVGLYATNIVLQEKK